MKRAQIDYQVKQVRERLAEGLVDKGILQTEKRNLLSDMSITDLRNKYAAVTRVVAFLTTGTSAVPPAALQAPGIFQAQIRGARDSVCTER